MQVAAMGLPNIRVFCGGDSMNIQRQEKHCARGAPNKNSKSRVRAFQPAEHNNRLELRRIKLQYGLALCNTILCPTCRKLEKLGEIRVLG